MKITLLQVALCASLASAGALGCGGDKSEPPAAPPEPPAAPPAAPEPAPAAQPAAPAVPAGTTLTAGPDGVVHVTANDQMRFNAARIEAKAGEKIKVELKNIGTLPKEAMGHNFVVLKSGVEAMPFATKAIAAKDNDYMPPDAMDQVIAHTKLLGPGESDTIEFEVPGPGTYVFVCTFPGHAALMNGQLVVSG
jgi:azurin